MWCILDRTYGESWHKAISCHNSPSYYTPWTLNLERIWACAQINRKLHYKKKRLSLIVFHNQGRVYLSRYLTNEYVIYASVKKSLKLLWHLHISRLFLFLLMIKSLLVWHISMFLSLFSRLDSTYVKILWSYVNVNLLFCQVCCNKC